MTWFLLACTTGSPPPPDLGTLPPFELTDQHGKTFTLDTLVGKVWVADFMFTSCPDVCPVLSARMAEVQAHYAQEERVHLVSFSVDPVTDTPPVLAAYVSRFTTDDRRWHLLTGEIQSVKRVVTEGFRMVMERPSEPAPAGGPAVTGSVLHGERFVIVDPRGHIRGYPDPKEPGMTEVYSTVDAILRE